MKILFFSLVPTDPGIAGNRVRIVTLTAALQQAGHEVHFAYLAMEPADLEAMAARFGAERLHVIAPIDAQSRLAGRATALARRAARALRMEWGYTWELDAWYHPNYSAFLADLQQRHGLDTVFVEYVFMSGAFEVFPEPCRRILDAHDRFGLRHRDFIASGMKARWFSTSMAEEERGFRRAHAVLAVQEVEAGNFGRRLEGQATQVVQVGHLIELQEPPRRAITHSAVFVGSDNPINTVGANFFIAQVMPRVRERLPNFQFIVAGNVSSTVNDAPGVVKLDFVDQLHDSFGRGAIAVNPDLLGTGVATKLLDALACALPFVSTESGACGLDQYRNTAVSVVANDDIDGFAGEVVRLLTDVDAAERMSQSARQAQRTGMAASCVGSTGSSKLPLAPSPAANAAPRALHRPRSPIPRAN